MYRYARSNLAYLCPVFLVGPTCVGKSEIAISLAQQINAEIVSCDSMQVYRGMDIATAKPSLQQRTLVPHYMVDIVDLDCGYDVARYREDACKIISNIQDRGKLPLIVGGTGLYIKALVDGLFTGPGRDRELRDRLEKRVEKEGLNSLYEELKGIDPVAYSKIKSRDKRRIIRALEIYYTTGMPISSFQKEWEKKVDRTRTLIGLEREREDLYARIERRVDEMFQKGLVKEIERLMKQGLLQNETAMQALGCKEVLGYLEGRYTLDEARCLLIRNTRRFAKRQLTWFRKDDRVKWFFIGKDENIEIIVSRLVDFLKEVHLIGAEE